MEASYISTDPHKDPETNLLPSHFQQRAVTV